MSKFKKVRSDKLTPVVRGTADELIPSLLPTRSNTKIARSSRRLRMLKQTSMTRTTHSRKLRMKTSERVEPRSCVSQHGRSHYSRSMRQIEDHGPSSAT